jgi:aspartate/methionine/tyrosine aminotransferase
MKQPIFAMERWQSHHENKVEYNLAESGVQPIRLDELREIAAVDPSDTLLGYGHTDGSPLLRERIAAMYPGAAAANVVATVGSAEANFLLAAGLGAQLESVWLEEDLGWQPAPGDAATAIQPGTRVVVVTNPNNPTAHPLGEAAIAEIVEAAENVGAWILSDEVYAGGEISGEPTPSMWGRTDRVLVSASLSKAYGLPGLRLGWLLAPPEFREELWARKDYTTIAPSPLSDRLGAAALEPAARELAGRLLAEQSVLIVPGDQFGIDHHFRIGYGYTSPPLAPGLERVSAMIDQLAGVQIR